MKSLLIILSHSGANDAVMRHWPYYRRSGCDILGIGREDTLCLWPDIGREFLGAIKVGVESYANGDNHIARFLSILDYLLVTRELKAYNAFCLIEYDGVFTKPLPEIKPGTFIAKLAGGRNGDFRGSGYYHTPWAMDRIMAGRVVLAGRAMLKAGLIEHGFVDRWLGLMFDLYSFAGINATDTSHGTYSQNTLDTQQKIADARRAIEQGAWYVHGVKTEAQLKSLTEGIA